MTSWKRLAMSALAMAALALVAAAPATAQQGDLAFGGFAHDASLPVEISAESLAVNQAEGTATFEGNVLVGQGTLRLSADKIVVHYDGEGQTGEVSRLEASGGVTLTNGAEAAEAEQAVYDVASGTVRMTGDVLLTQGENALSSQTLAIDLNSGTARMEGRVQTILQPQSAE